MGVLDVILGRDENGNISKTNLALIALMLWKMYQSTQGSGAPEPIPAPAPTGRRAEIPAPHETRQQAPIPTPSSSDGPDGGFGELTDSMNRMPEYRRDPGAGGGGSGGLGDILGDILGGGRGPAGRGGQPDGGGMPGGPGGGGLGDILGDILGGGRGPAGRGGQPGGPSGGGLGDILGDILGGGRGPRAQGVAGPQGDPFSDLLRSGGGGAGLGGLLGAGLGGLLQQFDQAGHGNEAQSWVSRDGNKPISPSDIESTFGADTINTLVQQLGVPRNELLSGLAQVLPQAIDQMTPDGRMPTPQEMSRWG